MPPLATMTDERQAGHGYPRPQRRRREWTALNGEWNFALDRPVASRNPTRCAGRIGFTCRFAKAPLSRVHATGFFRAGWYSRQLECPGISPGHHWLLEFGAVDYAATVRVDGRLAGSHEGGCTPFTTIPIRTASCAAIMPTKCCRACSAANTPGNGLPFADRAPRFRSKRSRAACAAANRPSRSIRSQPSASSTRPSRCSSAR
jgi:hypothetical protein